MKKMFACVLALCPMIASADYLDDKIASLTKEKLDKIAKLEECQKSTKGLKIAGITTLGVSAIGIGANIGEAVKLNKLEAQIGAAETNKSDLDRQISAAKEEKAKKEKAAEAEQERQRQAANNTCGDTVCSGDANLETLNAQDGICVQGAWMAEKCNEGFTGTQKTCTLNGQTVTYYENCSANASTDKPCPEIAQEWLTQNNVKSVECDKITGQNYITECVDTHTGEKDANGRITECKIKEQAQPVVQDRAHHSACTDAEKADLQSKGADEVWVYNNKCVPKSCKTGWYLVVKGDSSQGYCVKTCPDYQKVERWENGGQACDKLKSEPQTTVEETCLEKKQGWAYWKKTAQTCGCETTICGQNYRTTASSTDSGCMDRCVQYLKNMINDNSIQLKPDPSMNNSASVTVSKTSLPVCKQNSIPGIVQDMQCTLACDRYATGSGCKITQAKVSNNTCYCNPADGVIKPGRDMKGEVITYDYSYDATKFDAIATFVVDGQKYSAIGHVTVLRPSKHKQVLNRVVKEKLESLGYSNFKISCKGCP